METAARLTKYCWQRILRSELLESEDGTVMSMDMDRLTGPQRRRVKHKGHSRKTHAHTPGETCVICRPGWLPSHRRPAIHAWEDEAVRFRPYNRPWLQAMSGGKASGKSQVSGPPVR